MKIESEAVFYQVNLLWVRAVMNVVSSRTIKGRANVPKTGAFILASNHLGNTDPPVLTASIPRQIHWLTKAEWFETPVMGPAFKLGGMIPVRRFEADLAALRKAQEVLRDGGVLGMFPEGTRSRTGGLKEGEPGSALIALRTGAPILPVGIWGGESFKVPRDLFTRRRAHIRIGKPFTLPRPRRIHRRDVEEGTLAIMVAIARLLPEKYHGVYASAAEVNERRHESASAGPPARFDNSKHEFDAGG
jgi:1-acyl-sn-glycerol-3-phosphate acyltransferase